LSLHFSSFPAFCNSSAWRLDVESSTGSASTRRQAVRRMPLFPHARSLTYLLGLAVVSRSESELATNLLQADESASLAQIHSHIKSFSQVSLRPLPACHATFCLICPPAYRASLPPRPWPVLFLGRQNPLAARHECLLGMAPLRWHQVWPKTFQRRFMRGKSAAAALSGPQCSCP